MSEKNSVRTHRGVATAASKLLRDGRTSSATKRVAGSAMSNRKGTSKK